MKNLFILFFAACTAFAGTNPIHNSSFELGRADFGISRYIRPENRKVFLEPVFDTKEKIHGRQSIRFDNPGADMIELVSREYKLIPGRSYTFSWYMKSSAPVAIFVGQYCGEATPASKIWKTTASRVFRSSSEWKRYSFTFTAKGRKSWYFTLFRWEAEGKQNTATLWLDALQLEEGNSPTKYMPRSGIEAAFCGDKRVRLRGETLPCDLRIVNYTPREQNVRVNLNIRDTLMPEIVFPSQTISRNIPPNAEISIPVATETKRYGHFRLSGSMESGSGATPVGEWIFTEIPVPPKWKPGLLKGFATGLNCDFGMPTYGPFPCAYRAICSSDKQYMEFLRNSGTRLLRVHDGELSWKTLEPEPGKFNWAIADEHFQSALENGFALMPVLGNMFYLRDKRKQKRVNSPLPGWLLRSPGTRIHKMKGAWDGVSPDPRAWERFATTMALRYKGKIAAYEITNEPNIALPSAREYIPYLRSASEIIRKCDPETLVIGGGLTTDYDGKTNQFLKDMGESGVLKFCDALSFHPYASPLDSSPIPAHEAIRSLRNLLDRYAPNLPLWNTELYYIAPASASYYTIKASATHAPHLLRRYLIDLGEGIECSVLIQSSQLLQNELAPHWELGERFCYSGCIPHDRYTGQSVASYLLNGAKAIERLHWPSGATGYLYKMRNGMELAAFWKSSDSQPFVLELPEGEFEILDMYLNPINNRKEIALSEFPVFLRGRNLQNCMKNAQLRGAVSFRILSAFQFLRNHQPTLLLAVQNISSNKITAVVRPDFCVRPQTAEMEINEKTIFLFPCAKNGLSGSTKVYLSDGERNFTLSLPLLQRKLLRSGETGKGDSFSFTATSTETGLQMEIVVYDSERGPRKADTPWEGDSIELFFDSAPLQDPGEIHAGKNVRRLILAPPSSNGLPEQIKALGMNTANIRTKLIETDNGYRAETHIPWSELGMKSPNILGLDVKINNITRKERLSTEVWSGTSRNYRFRNRYGLWHPSSEKEISK